MSGRRCHPGFFRQKCSIILFPMKRAHDRFRTSGSVVVATACLLLMFSSPPVLSQTGKVTADDLEKNIASLPADERAYERFRYWMTTLTPSEQQSSNVDVRYREYLMKRGFSEAEANEQIKIVQAQSRRLEVERWNRILTAEKPAFNTNPNEFLVQM